MLRKYELYCRPKVRQAINDDDTLISVIIKSPPTMKAFANCNRPNVDFRKDASRVGAAHIARGTGKSGTTTFGQTSGEQQRIRKPSLEQIDQKPEDTALNRNARDHDAAQRAMRKREGVLIPQGSDGSRTRTSSARIRLDRLRTHMTNPMTGTTTARPKISTMLLTKMLSNIRTDLFRSLLSSNL